MSEALTAIANIEIIVAFVLTALFTIAYGTLFRWTKRAAGRAVFLFFCSVIVVLTLSLLGVWLGDYFLRPLWRMLGWSAVVAASGNLLRVLWLSHRKGTAPLFVEPRRTQELPVVSDSRAADTLTTNKEADNG